MTLNNRCRILMLCAVLGAIPAAAQTIDFMGSQAVNAIVKGAPYSAEGVTTVKMRLADGTHIDRSVTARIYRDSAGRERREQTVVGLETLDPAKDVFAVVIIVDPVSGYLYTLNPGTRDAHRLSLAALWNSAVSPPAMTPPVAVGPSEPLGERMIEGHKAVGTRTTITIPAGQVGNDRAITVVGEQWVGVDLKVVLLSRHSDPRSGEVEYKLTKIKRGEPAADLFQVPVGYTIRDNVLQ